MQVLFSLRMRLEFRRSITEPGDEAYYRISRWAKRTVETINFHGLSRTMVKVVSPISNREVEAVSVDFEAKAEPWATYELSDGSTIKLRTTPVGILRLEGEHDQAGNPMYTVSSNTVIRVVTAPKGLRGTPTVSVQMPGQKPAVTGPEVR